LYQATVKKETLNADEKGARDEDCMLIKAELAETPIEVSTALVESTVAISEETKTSSPHG
jgi:hypothetical protein